MEKEQQETAIVGNYEVWLRLFKGYFLYVVIAVLAYEVWTKDKRVTEVEKEKTDLMKDVIIDKQKSIDAWTKTQEQTNEIFHKMVQQRNHKDTND